MIQLLTTDFAVKGERPARGSPFDPAIFPMFLIEGLPIRLSFKVSLPVAAGALPP
jgi:hypothetical protein